MSLRFGFAGTPDFAARILQRLLEAEHRPACVYTQPDKARGRGRKLTFSPVKQLALAHDIDVYQPRSLRSEDSQREFAAHQLDLFIVAAYGLILPVPVLAAPSLGCLNVHASLLPRWRGAAPVERAIMAGDAQTGVCLMQMEQGLDTGPVYRSASIDITPTCTGGSLTERLAELGAVELLQLLPDLRQATALAQDDAAATYADKLTEEDARVDWHQPAAHIDRQIRALCDRMPASAVLGDVQVKLLACALLEQSSDAEPGTIVAAHKRGIDVATGDGLLRLLRAKLNRGKGSELAAADIINGYAEVFAPGNCFTSRSAAFGAA